MMPITDLVSTVVIAGISTGLMGLGFRWRLSGTLGVAMLAAVVLTCLVRIAYHS